MSENNRNFLKTTVSAVASSGLGALTISSAVSGNRSFVAADDGKTFDDIRIEETGVGAEIRNGCVYTHSGTSLSRGTLVDSTDPGGAALVFSAAAVVSQVLSAGTASRLDAMLQTNVPGGRLTLESGVPVSTSDQTAKTTIYYTPFVHNGINLWDGAKWVPTAFTEKSLALGTLTSGLPYDVFGYLSAGQLVLEALAWTNGTTRATAVTLQDGRYCKSGDKTRLLLGTFYTTSTTTTEDSASNRYVGNIYNKVPRRITSSSSASHTYTTASYREWNGGTSVTRANFITPILPEPFTASGVFQGSGTGAALGHVSGWVNGSLSVGNGGLYMNITGGIMGDMRVPFSFLVTPTVGLNYFSAGQYGNSGVTWSSYRYDGSILQ